MLKPFISYSHKDMSFTQRLVLDLQNEGYVVYWDGNSVSKGSDWDIEVERILNQENKVTDCVLFIASVNSFSSQNVRNELSFAQQNNITRIIPLMVEQCRVPMIVCRKSRIEFFDYNKGLAELLAELGKPQPVSLELDEEEIPELPTPLITTPILTTEQKNAAHETAHRTRLIAGPGTGKTFVIEERVRWLLEQGVSPSSIYIISFTKAASSDLRRRIIQRCVEKYPEVRQVNVSTLHSLALKILRKAKALDGFSTDPIVMDDWETKNILDEEFQAHLKHPSIEHCRNIRMFVEAGWAGDRNPNIKIKDGLEKPTKSEMDQFELFLKDFSSVYSAILVGYMVKRCVEEINAGSIDPIEYTQMRELIVDEYQDLNRADIELIKHFTTSGVRTFIAGDDDQCIYGFRHAYPEGIREFVSKDPTAAQYSLSVSYRCTSKILEVSQGFITKQITNRLEKLMRSNLKGEDIQGKTHYWKFNSYKTEAIAIAHSCSQLIAKGLEPSNIMVLIANKPLLLNYIRDEFKNHSLNAEYPMETGYADTEDGRIIYALVRAICDENLKDKLAHRTLLQSLPQIGIGACIKVKIEIIKKKLDYLSFFYGDLDPFENKVINNCFTRIRELTNTIQYWSMNDTLETRLPEIIDLGRFFWIDDSKRAKAITEFTEQIKDLPSETTLGELKYFLSSSTEFARKNLQIQIKNRLKQEDINPLERGIRVMTMHSAKGLEADVIFIPGLEKGIMPSDKQLGHPQLTEESARQLYVAITRARVACIFSWAAYRPDSSRKPKSATPSPFNIHLGGSFIARTAGLTDIEASEIANIIKNYRSHTLPPT